MRAGQLRSHVIGRVNEAGGASGFRTAWAERLARLNHLPDEMGIIAVKT